MVWRVKPWICGGFLAVRPDGEKVFIYTRLAWEPARYGDRPEAYEFRWHGRTAGRLTASDSWRRDLRLLFSLGPREPINEQDLLEISMGIVAGAEKAR